jgi:hypothetical protein
MHRELLRLGERPGRDRVERLMRREGLRGAKRRGKRWNTTTPDPDAQRPADLVKRDFSAPAPDRLWVSDFTYLSCWEGRAYWSFVLDVYSRMIVGWQLSGRMRTDLVLDALRMALLGRQPGADVLIAHSDAGSQGGFNWSSQHLTLEGGDGQISGMGERADRAGAAALAGTSAGGVTGGPGGVLAGNRRRDDDDRRSRARGRVRTGWQPMVSPRWRDANCHVRSAVGAVSVLR